MNPGDLARVVVQTILNPIDMSPSAKPKLLGTLKEGDFVLFIAEVGANDKLERDWALVVHQGQVGLAVLDRLQTWV